VGLIVKWDIPTIIFPLFSPPADMELEKDIEIPSF
jgi:hypothetical protein